jgi:hypothetical protein
MESKVRAEDLERALEPRNDDERTNTAGRTWTDGFRASGEKHAMV